MKSSLAKGNKFHSGNIKGYSNNVNIKYQSDAPTLTHFDMYYYAHNQKKLDLLNTVISVLANGHKLEAKYKDHNLTGKYKDFRECHIEPDWLLIYRIKNYELELYLFRTGSHSDLF